MSESSAEQIPPESGAHTRLALALVVALPAFSYPLAWASEQAVRHRFELQLPIPLIYLIAVFCVFAWRLRKVNTFQLPMIGIDRPLLAVLGVGVISTILSRNIYFSISSLLLLFAHVSLLYAVGLWFDPRRIRHLLVLWLAIATAEAVYGIWQRSQAGYPWGTIGNVDWMAAYLGISMLVCLPLWTDAARKGKQLLWLVPCTILMLVVFIWCDSLGAWLGLGGAATACAFRILWGRNRMQASIFAGATLMMAVAVGALKFSHFEALWHVNVRPQIWKGTLSMIGDSPVIGTGIGTYTYQFASYRPPEYFNTNVLASANLPEHFRHRRQPANLTDHAHNEFLEIAAESGMLGLVIMLWLLGTVIVRGWNGWRPENPHRWVVLGAWGALIALLIHNQFDINLRKPPCQTLLWLLMGLIVRCSRQTETAPKAGNGVQNGSGVPAALSTIPEPAAPPPPFARLLMMTFCFLLIALLAKRYVYDTVASNVAYRKALIARGKIDLESKPPFLSLTQLTEQERSLVEAAMENYLLSLKYDSFRVEAWYRLAFLCGRFRETDEQAIDYYMEVIRLAPDYGDVHSNLAFLFIARGRLQEAIPDFERAIELNPYNIELRVVLAKVFMELKLDRDLKQQLMEILRLDPNHPWANQIWQDRFKLEKMENSPHAPRRSKPRTNPTR